MKEAAPVSSSLWWRLTAFSAERPVSVMALWGRDGCLGFVSSSDWDLGLSDPVGTLGLGGRVKAAFLLCSGTGW